MSKSIISIVLIIIGLIIAGAWGLSIKNKKKKITNDIPPKQSLIEVEDEFKVDDTDFEQYDMTNKIFYWVDPKVKNWTNIQFSTYVPFTYDCTTTVKEKRLAMKRIAETFTANRDNKTGWHDWDAYTDKTLHFVFRDGKKKELKIYFQLEETQKFWFEYAQLEPLIILLMKSKIDNINYHLIMNCVDELIDQLVHESHTGSEKIITSECNKLVQNINVKLSRYPKVLFNSGPNWYEDFWCITIGVG